MAAFLILMFGAMSIGPVATEIVTPLFKYLGDDLRCPGV